MKIITAAKPRDAILHLRHFGYHFKKVVGPSRQLSFFVSSAIGIDNWDDFKAIQRYCNLKLIKGSAFFG